MIVKSGDTHDVKWKANMDLTGASVRLIASPATGAPLILASVISNTTEGEVTHTLAGDLPVGRYRVELEATVGGEIITFPNDTSARLDVYPDLD